MFSRYTGANLLVSGLLSASLLLSHAVLAHQSGDDAHAHHGSSAASPPSQEQSAEIKLLDRELVTQDNRQVKLRSDVIADKIVVMDFVYTTCTTVCPVLSAIMGQVQRRLGARVGAEVQMVSISVDSNTDTPGRLKAYARRVGAGPGWVWLTGHKPTVDLVLTGLGVYTPNFEDHPSLVLVGDGRTGSWSRFYGFPSPSQIVAKVEELLAARQSAVSAGIR